MTAIIVYLTREGAHLLTDGGQFGPDGPPIAFAQKVTIAAHQSAAFVARGPDLYGGLLRVVVGQHQGDFDSLAGAFPDLCRSAHAEMIRAVSTGTQVLGNPYQVDAVLIGWSERRGFQGFEVSSFDDAVPAWQRNNLASESPLAFCSPAEDTMVQSLLANGLDIWGMDVDPAKDGLSIMRAQRRTTTVVAGFCQITTVTQSGVFSRVLERWPDKITPLPGLGGTAAARRGQ